MSTIHEDILRHTARYALTLRPVLNALFYDGDPNGCDQDLVQLRKKRLVTGVENAVADPDDPHTSYSYYQLAKAGAKQIGASEYRARALGGQSVHRYLAFLWFCCIKRPRRHRITVPEVVTLFGDEVLPPADGKKRDLLLPGFHCLEKTKDSYRVLHLYAPRTSLADTVVELRKRLRQVREIDVVAQAIADHQYGFALLAETNEQRNALREQMARAFGDDPVSIIVARSPGPWRRIAE